MLKMLVLLCSLGLGTSAFAVGVQPIVGDCYAPDMPRRDAGSRAWNQYVLALNEYSYCKSQKANEAVEEYSKQGLEKAEDWWADVKSKLKP